MAIESDFQILDEATKGLRSAEISAGPTSDMIASTTSAMPRAGRRPAPWTILIAASLLIVVAIVAMKIVNNTASVAFADVVRRVEQSRTLTATLVPAFSGLQSAMPTRVMLKGDRMRMESDQWVFIQDKSSGVS